MMPGVHIVDEARGCIWVKRGGFFIRDLLQSVGTTINLQSSRIIQTPGKFKQKGEEEDSAAGAPEGTT